MTLEIQDIAWNNFCDDFEKAQKKWDAPFMTEDIMTSWKLFEIECPDGRVIRHRHENLDHAKKALLEGYKVSGEVFGASTDDKGGIVGPLGPGTTSVMKTLLDAHGDELLAWLEKRGIS